MENSINSCSAAQSLGDDPSHVEIAQAIISSIGKENILYSNNTFWQWDQRGLWRKLDDREIKQHIQARCATLLKKFNKHTIESILDMIKTATYDRNFKFNEAKKFINVLNGELHYNGGNWNLSPPVRENYLTTQLPVNFIPNAQAPRFEQFLDEVFRDDTDRDFKKILVCEFIGYSLLPSCEYEKFIILIGPGANGKSVLMNILAALVGLENIAAVQPSMFDNRFQRAHLHNKLVNLVTEIAEGHEIADAQLKAIVSGELTTAEHKLKPPFEFKPYATCWFGTNHMPHTRDFSQALMRRALILTFNRVFGENEQDKHLIDKLRLELSGILNLSLEALAGVFEANTFTTPESTTCAKEEWRLECDQAAQFFEERCYIEQGISETSAALYSEYGDWAKNAGIKQVLNRKNFTNRLLRLGARLDRGTGGVRQIVGVGLKK